MQAKASELWFKGLNPEEREEMRLLLVNNEKLLDKLKEILYNIQVKKETSVLDDYDTPSWSHKQAHQNGEAAAIRKILDIITIRERDDRPTI